MPKKRNLVLISLSSLLNHSNPNFISSFLSAPPQISLSSSASPQDSRCSTLPTNNYTSLFLQNSRFSLKSFLCSQSTNNGVLACWSCGRVPDTMSFLVCEDCKSVQPVDPSIDYFQIFGLERKYEIEENLEGKYKNWQKRLHPDLVHTKSEKEREYAAEQSARVTDAYRTLSKSLSRAIYIIMEIREAVTEASDLQALNQIQSKLRAPPRATIRSQTVMQKVIAHAKLSTKWKLIGACRMKAIQEKMEHWSKSFAGAFKEKKFEEALDSIQRMTYYDRVNEEIIRKS